MKSRCLKLLLLPTVLLLALAVAQPAKAHHPGCGPRIGFNFSIGGVYRPYPYVRPYPYYGYAYPVYPAYPVAVYPAYPAAYPPPYAAPGYSAYSYPRYDSGYGGYAW